MKKIIIGLLLILNILIIGCAKQPVLGGDKDEHGCIGSAGYSWCDTKQKCLRTWEENCTEINNTQVHVCTEQESLATACTMDYNPVCGELLLNVGKTVYQTFSNGCSACAALKVVSYTPGECSIDKIKYSCETDSDCVSTCGEKCVNKDWAQTYNDTCVNVRAWTCTCVDNICYTDGHAPY